jgi:hypothetical protein
LVWGDQIDIEKNWREYATARDHSRGRIARGPASIGSVDAHEMLEFKLRTKEFIYTEQSPQLYSPWKTYDNIRAFSA